MGRFRKNKFEKSLIRFETGTEFELNQVKIPFWVNVTYKVPISEDKNRKKLYGTTTVLIKKDISEKDEITKAFQKEDYKVINIEERTIPFSDLCPNCNRKGIPKIEIKSNKYDYHPRAVSPYFREPGTVKTEVNRPYEHWLCYDHETKPKKCRVAKWDKNHLIFTKNGKIYTKLRKYIFPKYVEWKQGELDAFDSFQKFINVFNF